MSKTFSPIYIGTSHLALTLMIWEGLGKVHSSSYKREEARGHGPKPTTMWGGVGGGRMASWWEAWGDFWTHVAPDMCVTRDVHCAAFFFAQTTTAHNLYLDPQLRLS